MSRERSEHQVGSIYAIQVPFCPNQRTIQLHRQYEAIGMRALVDRKELVFMAGVLLAYLDTWPAKNLMCLTNSAT